MEIIKKTAKTFFLVLCVVLISATVQGQKKKGKRGQITEAQKIEFSNLFMAGQKQKMIDNPEEALKFF